MKSWVHSHFVASVASAMVFLVGCAPAAQGPQTGGAAPNLPAGKPADQKLVIGQASITPNMHPYFSICCTQRRYDVFDTIVGQKADGSVEPMAATSWRLVDPTTWQFTLRTDMKFHNGDALTVDDIVFSVNRATDINKKYAVTSRVDTVKEATKIDATTMKVVTKAPDPLLVKRMAMVSILPKTYIDKVGDEDFGLKPIGSGPFKLKEFIPDTRIVVEAVEHPFRRSNNIREVTIRNIPEAAARVAGLRSGDLDMADNIPIDASDGLKAANFTIVPIDFGSSTGYWMDTVVNGQLKTGPIADKRVRQAINYAIDKEAIAKSIYKGLTKPESGQFVQDVVFGYNPRLKAYPFDQKKAKELLAAAGYDKGFKLRLESQTINAEVNQTHLFVQDQLKQVGIDLEIVPLGEYAIFRDKFYGDKERSDLFPPGLITTPLMDASLALVWFWSGQSAVGRHHYRNPDFDSIFEQSQTELNDSKRQDLLQRAFEIMYDDPPYVWLVQNVRLVAHSAKVQGVEKRTDVEQRFEKLSIKS